MLVDSPLSGRGEDLLSALVTDAAFATNVVEGFKQTFVSL